MCHLQIFPLCTNKCFIFMQYLLYLSVLTVILCRLWIPTTKILGISRDWHLQFPQGGFCMQGQQIISINSYIWTRVNCVLLLPTWFLFSLLRRKLEDCCLEALFWSLQLIKYCTLAYPCLWFYVNHTRAFCFSFECHVSLL